MARITRVELFMQVAYLFSKRSTCLRGQVGAVAVIDKRIIATGYNGAPEGFPHCTSETCNAEKPCENTIHAEANLIAFAARAGIKLEGATLYCTHAPCKKCAQLILQSGISSLYFSQAYHDDSGLKVLWEGERKVTIKQYTIS